MILEVEALVDGQKTSFPSTFYRILVLILLLALEVLEWDHFEKYVLQKDDQQIKRL